MIAREIKDLAIALEALTRVQGVEQEFAAVRQLLNEAIGEKHKENNPPQTHRSPTNKDDEIPF